MIDFIRTLTKIEKEIHKILHSEMKEEKIEEEKTNITSNLFFYNYFVLLIYHKGNKFSSKQ